ncbi:hypothetical protein Aduo_016148 [Ancylostoma duodenale]
MEMTHLTAPMKRDLILDRRYITLSSQGLAIGYTYFRKQCLHIDSTCAGPSRRAWTPSTQTLRRTLPYGGGALKSHIILLD